MVSEWDVALRIQSNARAFSLHKRMLKYEPVEQFLRASRNLIRILYEPELRDLTGEARYRLWRIQNTIRYSLLPFDSSALNLESLLKGSIRSLNGIPDYEKYKGSIKQTTEFLLTNPHNPKQDQVAELLRGWVRDPALVAIGIVAPPARTAACGWDGEIPEFLNSVNPRTEIIRSSAAYQASVWSAVLLPFGGKECRFIHELFEGYRSPRLELVAYAKEPMPDFRKVSLPKPGSRWTRSSTTSSVGTESAPQSAAELELERQFWEGLKTALRVEKSSCEAEETYFMPARLVLLAGGQMVYLATNGRELVVRFTAAQDDDDTLCYRKVPAIQEGDFLVLRTGKSTDLVRTISEDMMRIDDCLDGCSDVFDWKVMLRDSLKETGSEEVCRRLAEKGEDISQNYIGIWTGQLVMRPGSRMRFEALIRVLQEIGTYSGAFPVSEYVIDRWAKMSLIESYNRKAGFRIRSALLTSLENICCQSVSINDVHRVKLDSEFPGAEITLFRVLDIDDKDTDVPEGQLGKLMSLGDGEDPWQE